MELNRRNFSFIVLKTKSKYYLLKLYTIFILKILKTYLNEQTNSSYRRNRLGRQKTS